MKRQNIKRSLTNFKLQYLHLVVKSPKCIFGGTQVGTVSGTVDGAIDGSADGYEDGYLDGEVDGYGD